jgi:hypothetical protein
MAEEGPPNRRRRTATNRDRYFEDLNDTDDINDTLAQHNQIIRDIRAVLERRRRGEPIEDMVERINDEAATAIDEINNYAEADMTRLNPRQIENLEKLRNSIRQVGEMYNTLRTSLSAVYEIRDRGLLHFLKQRERRGK